MPGFASFGRWSLLLWFAGKPSVAPGHFQKGLCSVFLDVSCFRFVKVSTSSFAALFTFNSR